MGCEVGESVEMEGKGVGERVGDLEGERDVFSLGKFVGDEVGERVGELER